MGEKYGLVSIAWLMHALIHALLFLFCLFYGEEVYSRGVRVGQEGLHTRICMVHVIWIFKEKHANILLVI